jgi:hypothetical protein
MSAPESTDSHHHHHHHHHHHRKDASPAAGAPPHRFIGEDELLTSLEKKDIVKVVEETLDLNAIANEVASTAAGAIATFSGTTRDHHNGKRVLKLEYEAYVPMAEKEMMKICQEMRKKWPVRLIFFGFFFLISNFIHTRLFMWPCITATDLCPSQKRASSSPCLRFIVETLSRRVNTVLMKSKLKFLFGKRNFTRMARRGRKMQNGARATSAEPVVEL